MRNTTIALGAMAALLAVAYFVKVESMPIQTAMVLAFWLCASIPLRAMFRLWISRGSPSLDDLIKSPGFHLRLAWAVLPVPLILLFFGAEETIRERPWIVVGLLVACMAHAFSASLWRYQPGGALSDALSARN